MKNSRRTFKALLVALALAATLGLSGARTYAGQNTNSSTTESDKMQRDIEKGTRKCIRDADRRYRACLRRAGRGKSKRARCRTTHQTEVSACSG
jgi:uncharacterized protein HemX